MSANIRHALAKVPQITAIFWIIKILTTGMGETASDYLVTHMDPVIGVVLGGIGLAVALLLQFVARRYVAWAYWLAVVMVSIFGTMAADVVHIVLGVPYVASSMFFSIALAAIFLFWYLREKTLSIHSIYTRHREAFYWATVLTTFALGTAVGDFTATTLKLGYFGSGILFAIIIALPAFAYWFFSLNEIFAFWFAYIMTRPLGASFADWIGVSHARGGLAWGTGPVTLALALLIFGLVGYLALTRKDVERR
ncbi:MAG: putative rane-anchored protein [Parcubacteria group bacterium]|nr:putative rane-anchored protein [Parcubacteria group bacterium]